VSVMERANETTRPGDVRVSVSVESQCQNLKQGCIRILPGVQTASSQLITRSSTEVFWAIHSMLIGENSSPIFVFLSDHCRLSKRPVISSDLQQSILTQLTSLFDGVAAHYQLIRDARKKKSIATSSSHEMTENAVTVSEPNQEPHCLSTSAPPIIPHITVGINEVTKALEREIQSRRTINTPSTVDHETQSLTKVVFICYADLDTPAFVAHLPQLVALCNSARSEHHKIKVVQLPAGAQISLTDALGYLKRVAVIALDVCPFRLLS
jgi:hypothetical protein